MLSPFIKDHIYDDPMWPKPPLPPLAPFIQAHQIHVPELRQVEGMCQLLRYITKLEGIQKQDLFVVLYDTYYGQKLLFDELHQYDTYYGQKPMEAIYGEESRTT
ncbi:hypothetical protein PanWU01x14_110350 [Parasponia andersonii]|uniref:Uncharacterized protein n=1 Tax=Parasponia andersonii TaxID=3476 RepID=A0A2P5CZ99_PARAD|nr:hypothetical protein PanWU01x14_110350 [Parasponia andersonii]